jgi:hypothetical protein
MNHYDVRGRYSAELGNILAQKYDINVAANGILAARAAATITGEAGGSQISNAAMATDVNVLTSALFASAQTLDEKFVPTEGRNAFVRPAQFYALAQNTNLINKFLGGEGSIAKGEIDTVAGFPIVKTNNIPSTDLSADATVSPSAQGNFATTVRSRRSQGRCRHREAPRPVDGKRSRNPPSGLVLRRQVRSRSRHPPSRGFHRIGRRVIHFPHRV